jgi:hypothetical protein
MDTNTFNKELAELDKKIRLAGAMMDVTPIESPDALRARSIELTALIIEQIKILEHRHEYLSDQITSIQEQTERFLGRKLHQCPKCEKSFSELNYSKHVKSCGRINKGTESVVGNSATQSNITKLQ